MLNKIGLKFTQKPINEKLMNYSKKVELNYKLVNNRLIINSKLI